MRHLPCTTLLFAVLLLSGCAVAPWSYDTVMEANRTTRNDVPDWAMEMRYRVGFQYANTARHKLENPSIEVPADRTMGFQVPFAIWDYAQGYELSAGLGFMDWFNSGMSGSARYAHYFNRDLGYVGQANTQYYRFDARDGVATTEDVHAAWDAAYTLFQAIHNRSGTCKVYGYNEKDQYRLTFPKNVPGLYKEFAYQCPHPTLANAQQTVNVSAWANPFDDIRVLAAVQSQCYIDPPKGQDFLDVRECGMPLAEQQRPYIPEDDWMELVTTPKSDDPYVFEVITRYRNDLAILPAPELTAEFTDFLKAQDAESD